MNLFKKKPTSYLQLYQEISGSDLKGEIPNMKIVEELYAIMCIDQSAHAVKVSMPDIAYPVVARELLDLYSTLKSNMIDGEDYSYMSLESLADAFMVYLRNTRKDIKDVHSMSRYDFAKDVITHIADL